MIQLSDKSEEILEHLWIKIEEENQHANLDIVPEEELRALEANGLIKLSGNDMSLTPKGRNEARMCVRRHRLAERLVADILDAGGEELHAASCKFEHGLHRGIEEKVCTMLGHPRVCPHGKPIPPGECCRRLKRETGPLLTSVSEMKVREKGIIAYLHSEDISDLRKLMALGALPGTTLLVRQRFPSYIIEIGHSQFGIDKEMARQIYVRHLEQ